MTSDQLSNGLIGIGMLIGAGFGPIIYLGWKVLKALERIETGLKDRK
jgi:hypothetical protein